MENQENQEKKHKRRVRYSGTHPRNYKEKYKELNPEKYADTISKVIKKGGTPAGMHISICVNEILDFFDIQPGQQGLDATLGYGGHTSKMLEKLQGEGHIYGLDVDPIESAKTKKRLRISQISIKWQKRPESLISYWQIWVCHLCRLTIRTVVLHSRQRDL